MGIVARFLLVLAICATSCADPRDRRELPPAEQAQSYKGTWEYRYGESPRREGGQPVWAEPLPNEGSWKPTTTLAKPPGRSGRDNLWLRTRLSGPVLPEPIFFVPYTRQSFEAYLDGKLIASFGQLEGAQARRFPGKRATYLPLGADYNGKLLVLRIHSSESLVGVWGQTLIGAPAAVLATVVRGQLAPTLLGAGFMALGFILLGLYLVQRSDLAYFLYSCSSLLLGVYLIAGSALRSFFFEEPVFWYHVELGSLCLLGAAVCKLTSSVLSPGPFRMVDWVARLFIVFFVGLAALLAIGKVQIGIALTPLQLLWLLLVLVHIFIAVLESFRGNLDARIFTSGMGVAAIITLYEMLQQLALLPRVISVVHYAGAVLMLTLGLILARRFAAVHKRLTDYSTVMQLSFSAAQDLSPGHQAQLALAELLRILHAARGLIFLCKSDGSALELVAGRDASGKMLMDPATQPQHDAQLVALVQKKRRPLTREHTPATDEATQTQRHSAVASPLLARGELLGVLYLEAHEARVPFGREDVEILLGLGNQVALTLMATRAGKLESETAQAHKLLSQQEALLEAAARMARGDLQSSITVPESSELLPLAQALDSMRRDLLIKFHLLETSNAAVKQHNEELRHKIDQRLRRLMELAERSDAKIKSARDKISTSGLFAPTAASLRTGTLLGDSYRIMALLGEGRSGSVYEVERIKDGERLAVKLLSDRSDKTVSLRFAREAQILARLSHPNVVAIVDVDITADGLLFMVMELVRGTPLNRCRERYADRGFVVDVLKQIAAGLCSIHEHNIVHRDLKPANVLIAEIDGRPQVKLVDFGVSTLSRGQSSDNLPKAAPLPRLNEESSSDTRGSLTAAGILVGTPLYLAPELSEGSHLARPPSDIFSFGVIAYELFADALPFSEPPVVTRYRGLPLHVPPFQFVYHALPPPAVALLERCLAEDPALRPTAEEILAVLAALPS